MAALLLPEVQPWLCGSVVSTTLHRWRYSEPKTTHPEPCVWLPDLALGFAGDAFGGPKVEGAGSSGLALARLMGWITTNPSAAGGATRCEG